MGVAEVLQFYDSNRLFPAWGFGGFGYDYKGQLDNDFHVAVKKLNGGGMDLEREYEVPFHKLFAVFSFI